MTAEIALLNRKAVALAADSQVSLILGNQVVKTYATAEKIFELSRDKPIGLMVYNTMEILDIPIEILVREFRKKINNQIPTIKEVWPQFREFLQIESQKYSYPNIPHFQDLISRTLNIVESFSDAKIETALDSITNFLNPIGNLLKGVDVNKFENVYGPSISDLVDNHYPKIKRLLSSNNNDIYWKLQKLALTTMKSGVSTTNTTGLVFAGFGEDELFPSLSYVEIDGIFFDEVRVVKEETVSINRRKITSRIVPFAQKVMPDRFVFGIDDEYENEMHNFVSETIDSILIQFLELDSTRKTEIKTNAQNLFRSHLGTLKSSTSHRNFEAVKHLSKEELSEFAYSLVDLSSKDHQFSEKIETVGGPIDVAVLTKNEGFIWVKRKKYFDLAINPSYTNRRKIGN